MTKPELRNPEIVQRLPYRDWIRTNLPEGSEGFVCEDIDLVVRVYSWKFKTDSIGKFMFIELKYQTSKIETAQKMTFGLIDKVCRQGDPEKKRYAGYFVVQYADNDWDVSLFRINGVALNREEFLKFLQFDEQVLDTLPHFLDPDINYWEWVQEDDGDW